MEITRFGGKLICISLSFGFFTSSHFLLFVFAMPSLLIRKIINHWMLCRQSEGEKTGEIMFHLNAFDSECYLWLFRQKLRHKLWTKAIYEVLIANSDSKKKVSLFFSPFIHRCVADWEQGVDVFLSLSTLQQHKFCSQSASNYHVTQASHRNNSSYIKYNKL